MSFSLNFTGVRGDAGGFERMLQTDADFRAAFFQDPVGTLRSAGFTLSPSQQSNLIFSVNRLRSESTSEE